MLFCQYLVTGTRTKVSDSPAQAVMNEIQRADIRGGLNGVHHDLCSIGRMQILKSDSPAGNQGTWKFPIFRGFGRF